MASMRTLRRRLLRQQRYAARTCFRVSQPWAWQPHAGFRRAAKAVETENERRFWAETPEIWLGGPEGEQALIADVLDWPPPTSEEQRRIDHRDACWDGCDDLHDDACEECGRSDCLGDCWDDGASWSEPAEAWVVTEYGFAERGLL